MIIHRRRIHQTRNGMWTYVAAVFTILMVNFQRISAAQSLVEGPSDTSVNLNASSVTLNCIITEMSGELFWIFGGNVIQASSTDRSLPAYRRFSIVGDQASGEYNLQITGVELIDDGVYDCQVTPGSNNEEALLSTPARLTVRRPPIAVTIHDGPQKTVDVGVPSNISCTATNANPAVSISWHKNGEPIEGALISILPSSDPSGKLWDTKSFLKIMPDVEDQQARYDCLAINAAISIAMRDSVVLDVQHPPVVIVETIPAELREGLWVFVHCVADANPKGVFYQWSKNGEPIPGNTNQLELHMEKSHNQAVVTCIATNSIGTGEGSLTLDVKYGPRFVDIPGETSVDEGELAQLQCSADGNPPATIKWTRIGSRATLSTMQKLQFDSVQVSDVGVYECEAKVDGFEPVRSYGRVDINSVPVIQFKEKQLVRRGSTSRIECITESKPEPEAIIWSWDEMELDEGSSGRFSVSQEERGNSFVGVLTIRKVQQSDFTLYNCTVVNAKGSAEAIILLEQQGLDFLFYVIIFVVSLALFIFIMSILFMVYCRRKLRRSSASSTTSSDDDEKKVKVEIIRKLSDLHLSDEDRRKLAGTLGSRHSSRGSPSPPRYAEPAEYIPKRRDSWEDPTYRPLSVSSRTPPPYGEEDIDRRYSHPSTHEYMEAGDRSYRGRYRDDRQEGHRPSDRNSYSRRFGNNQGYGYFEDSARISISGNPTDPSYPDENEKLVERDDVSRRSNLSMNSRNKLATIV